MTTPNGAADLLPSNAQPFETCLAEALTDALPVPIRDTLDAATTPPAFLPFLAAHESVDLWFSDWPEERKRHMIAEATDLAALKGTRAALERFLGYVDAEITWRISHPARFVIGRSAIGVRPIGHRPMTAHYIVRSPLRLPANPFRIGRAALGIRPLTRVSLEPLRRAKVAAVVSKAPETLYSMNFAHRRRARFGDALPMDGSMTFGGFIHRPRF